MLVSILDLNDQELNDQMWENFLLDPFHTARAMTAPQIFAGPLLLITYVFNVTFHTAQTSSAGEMQRGCPLASLWARIRKFC